MRYIPKSEPSAVLRSIGVTPLLRLWEAPAEGKLVGAVASAAGYLLGAPFVLLTLLLCAVGLLDYLLGAAIARGAGRYDSHVARMGALGKASGVLLVLIIRAIEAVIAVAGLVDTQGALATALGVVLLVVELESYDGHRETLTGRPTPLLRPMLDMLRGLAQGLLPGTRKAGP